MIDGLKRVMVMLGTWLSAIFLFLLVVSVFLISLSMELKGLIIYVATVVIFFVLLFIISCGLHFLDEGEDNDKQDGGGDESL